MYHRKETKATDGELEILRILWQKKKASVREVYEIISKTKDCGYTTTLKLMQIMYEKKLVTRNTDSKTHIYQPKVSRESLQKNLLGKIIDNVFEGSSTSLIMRALGENKPSPDELDQIQELLNRLKEEKNQ